MKDILIQLFGSYVPVTDSVTGSVVAGFAGVDWPWIASAVLFGLVLYSFFRLVGVLLKK